MSQGSPLWHDYYCNTCDVPSHWINKRSKKRKEKKKKWNNNVGEHTHYTLGGGWIYIWPPFSHSWYGYYRSASVYISIFFSTVFPWAHLILFFRNRICPRAKFTYIVHFSSKRVFLLWYPCICLLFFMVCFVCLIIVILCPCTIYIQAAISITSSILSTSVGRVLFCIVIESWRSHRS